MKLFSLNRSNTRPPQNKEKHVCPAALGRERATSDLTRLLGKMPEKSAGLRSYKPGAPGQRLRQPVRRSTGMSPGGNSPHQLADAVGSRVRQNGKHVRAEFRASQQRVLQGIIRGPPWRPVSGEGTWLLKNASRIPWGGQNPSSFR